MIKKKESACLIKVIIAGLTGLIVFLQLGWSFFTMVCKKKEHKKPIKRKWKQLKQKQINHPRNGYEKEYESGKQWCMEQEMDDWYMRSEDSLLLHARYLKAEEPERIILLAHGYRGSGYGDFANIARFLHENHCNLLFIDQRCCGESEGEYITFGALEHKDVQRWATYLSKRNSARLPIYLYGMSMGAASVLMASGTKLPKEVKGIIADCGFRSMKKQIQDMAKTWFHLDWIKLMLIRLNIFCYVMAGFWMKDADTTKAMEMNQRPILFFHGALDTFVDPKHSRYNYHMCKAPKELVVVEGARHLCSNYVEPELYRSKVLEFFRKYDIM